jgi:hypothetical protein
MSKKLKIFTLPNKELKYLRLQIESYKKYMSSPDVEFIVINGSIHDREEINEICKEEGINVEQYFGESNWGPIEYGTKHYNWFVDNMIRGSSDYVMLIHPDMFFIDQIDYKSLLSDKKIRFVPRYTHDFFYMWEGIILLDAEFFNSSGLMDHFDITGFLKGPHGWTDGGGASSKLLEKMNPEDYGFFEFWNLHDFDDNSYMTNLNGHARYKFDLPDRKLIWDVTGEEGPHLGNRTYPYEEWREDYRDYYIDNFLWIKDNFISGFPFPRPVHIDLICKAGDVKNPFIIHFKSGSGYQDFFNLDYQEQKINALREVIHRNLKQK